MGLYKPRATQFWWCRFQIAGVEIRKSTGEVDRRRAKIVERRLRAEAETLAPKRRGPRDKTLADLGALDIHRASELGAQRAQTIRETWRPIMRLMGDPLAHAIVARDISGYISARVSQKVRGQTIRRELQAIKRGLILGGYSVPEPWPSARTDRRLKSSPPKQANAGKLHSEAVVWRWLEELPHDARDEALFIWLTGLRLYECHRVLPEWIRGAGAGSLVPAYLDVPAEASKTRKPRTVGLSTEAIEILHRRMVAPGVAIFPAVDRKRTYRMAARSIGYPVCITPRDLRHMHLTSGAYLTGDVKAVMAIAGHNDLETTSLYLHVTEERTAAVAAAVAGLVVKARPSQRAIEGKIYVVS